MMIMLQRKHSSCSQENLQYRNSIHTKLYTTLSRMVESLRVSGELRAHSKIVEVDQRGFYTQKSDGKTDVSQNHMAAL